MYLPNVERSCTNPSQRRRLHPCKGRREKKKTEKNNRAWRFVIDELSLSCIWRTIYHNYLDVFNSLCMLISPVLHFISFNYTVKYINIVKFSKFVFMIRHSNDIFFISWCVLRIPKLLFFLYKRCIYLYLDMTRLSSLSTCFSEIPYHRFFKSPYYLFCPLNFLLKI